MGGDNKIQYQSRAYPAVEVPDNNQFDALFSSLYTGQNQQVLCDPKKHNTVLVRTVKLFNGTQNFRKI